MLVSDSIRAAVAVSLASYSVPPVCVKYTPTYPQQCFPISNYRTAPEIFAPKGYGLAADVYSLGVLLWETLCTSPERASSNPLVGLDPDEGIAQVRTRWYTA